MPRRLQPSRLLSVGVGDLSDKLGPSHIHRAVNLAGLRSRIVPEDFHHQPRIVRDNYARLEHAQESDLTLGLAESPRGIDRYIGVQPLSGRLPIPSQLASSTVKPRDIDTTSAT